MLFIEPMHRNKPNITYLLTIMLSWIVTYLKALKTPKRIWQNIQDTVLINYEHRNKSLKHLKFDRRASTNQLYCDIYLLTHWGRVTHICVSKLTVIGSDNGLSPERRRANIWTNAGILLFGTLGTHFSEILNAFENIVCETAAILSRPQCVKGTCKPQVG